MQVSSKSIAIGAAALTLGLEGCAPNPKNVGNGLDSDATTAEGSESSESSTSGADSNTQSSAAETDDTDDTGTNDVEPLWLEILSGGQQGFTMARMPSGGVVLGSWAPGAGTDSVLTRYSESGDVLWQIPLGWSIHDIETLDDDRIFVAGDIKVEERTQAALWRVSPAGVVEEQLIHLPEGEDDFSVARSLSVSSTGIAYNLFTRSIQTNSQENELLRGDLDLSTQWSWSGFNDFPAGVALLPSGEIRTLEGNDSQALADVLRSFSADGMALGVESIPPARFAQDAPLVLVGISDDDVWVQGLDDTSELMASFPGYGSLPLGPSTHGPGMGIVMDGGDDFTVLQRAPDGRTREMNFPSPCLDVVNPRDIVLGLDGSLFVSGSCRSFSDSAPEDWVGFLLALPPI